MRPFLRVPGIVLLAALLAIGAATPVPASATLAAVLARTDYPLTVIVTATPAVAYVDGVAGAIFVVAVDPSVAYDGDADLLAFVLLHELGHVVLGHLELQRPPADRMRDAWDKELAADAFAVRAMLLYGLDPLRAAEQFFTAYPYGDAAHPSGAVRLAQVRAMVGLASTVPADAEPLPLMPRGVAVP